MKSLFNKFKSGLQKTRTYLTRSITTMFSDVETWTDENFDDLEAALVSADLGIGVSTRIVDDIRDRYARGVIQTTDDILRVAREDMIRTLDSGEAPPLNMAASGPTVILLVGVNGSGKTTTAGKLGHMWKAEGKHVMYAACDTFRAAATEQLKLWGERVGASVIAGKHGSDAASVAYDAVSAAVARDADVLVIDTAGRQHTKSGLMEELSKIRRTIDKACPGAPHETWLVVDGSTGTNALSQARAFTQAADLSGLVLTKIDGTGKGGVVVAIHDELQLPVRFIGLGEQPDDLQPFDAKFFAEAIFQQD